MEHISLKILDTIRDTFPDNLGELEKDLCDNEVICPTCHGLGIVIRNQPFKLDNANKWFNNEYFSLCPDCYNGVQSLCKYCGKPIEKEYITKCDCDEYVKLERKVSQQIQQDIINKSKQVDIKDVSTYLYCVENNTYYSDIEDFTERQHKNYLKNGFKNIPSLLWVTEEVNISLDADSICENACDELHEDAMDNCDIKSLQEVLDDWCEKQTGTTTYYPCYKEYIKVEEEWFKE